jgi:hypothetical protein
MITASAGMVQVPKICLTTGAKSFLMFGLSRIYQSTRNVWVLQPCNRGARIPRIWRFMIFCSPQFWGYIYITYIYITYIYITYIYITYIYITYIYITYIYNCIIYIYMYAQFSQTQASDRGMCDNVCVLTAVTCWGIRAVSYIWWIGTQHFSTWRMQRPVVPGLQGEAPKQ